MMYTNEIEIKHLLSRLDYLQEKIKEILDEYSTDKDNEKQNEKD